MTGDHSELIPPVLVIGSTRSGTSMLVRLLGDSPGAEAWYEAQTVWRIGHARRSHERATREDATPGVRRKIHDLFLRKQHEYGGKRVIEKTPSNVLRIQFVHEVFPDAKIVHIVRDGRAYLLSQLEKLAGNYSYKLTSSDTRHHLRRRLRETPWWEWGAYLPRVIEGVYHRHIRRKSGTPWFGLRYPGWEDDRSRLTPAQICATQWTWAIETATNDLEQIPQDRWLQVRYEDFVANPRKHLGEIYEFCELEGDEAFVDSIAAKVRTSSVERWRSDLTRQALDEAMPIMAPCLEMLGYQSEHAMSSEDA